MSVWAVAAVVYLAVQVPVAVATGRWLARRHNGPYTPAAPLPHGTLSEAGSGGCSGVTGERRGGTPQ